MTYLLDTPAISETVRQEPNRKVADWLGGIPDDALHISVLTVGELRKGVERLRAGTRRDRLAYWLDVSLPQWFGTRIIPVGVAEADRWGRLLATVGKSVPISDSLIAATALHHDLRLVTRNERDFARFPGLVVVNPWRM